MVDWNRLAIEPSVRRLGEVLREYFEAWVGFVDSSGGVVPIASDREGVERPACEVFKARSALENRRPGYPICGDSLRSWVEAAKHSDRPFMETTCHAGLSSLVYPLGREGEFLGCLYVSGWVPSEDSHKHLGELRERLKHDPLVADDVLEEFDTLVDAVPRLNRRDRRFMSVICEGIRREFERLAEQRCAEPGPEGNEFQGMIGATQTMRSLFEMIRRVARGQSTVLIQGENGTGKELIARALHRESRRGDQAFVALNCAAIPGELIASELFGHKRGAFSGAHRDRAGLIEEADGGSLFLDEIGDMDLHLQVKLLRFLQEGTYSRVGESTVKRVDVRVICATNQDLGKMVRERTFRKDLYFRINVISLIAPPLRERRADIELLANHFLNRSVRRLGRDKKVLLAETIEALKAHKWPGNVRELENEVERLVLMAGDEPEIGAASLSSRIVPQNAEPSFPVAEEMSLPAAMEQLEKAMILNQLKKTGWNKSQTARDLDVSRRNIIRKVAQYDLERFRED